MIEAELPDGTVLVFEEGTPTDVIQRVVKQRLGVKPQAPQEERSQLAALGGAVGQGVGNVALGAQNLVGMGLEKLGADQVGQWLQKDAATGKAKLQGEIDPYQQQHPMTVAGGRLAGEAAATLPVGGALAKGVSMVPGAATRAAPLIQALRTGGASTGVPTAAFFSKEGAKQLATRMAGGAGTGYGASVLTNPDEAGAGAVIGGALPLIGRTASAFASNFTPQSLMQSALKPTIEQLRTGDAKTAIDTLLKYSINATSGGVDQVKSMIGGVDDEISQAIAGSNAKIAKKDVLQRLDDVRGRFASQVTPEADLSGISRVGEEFGAHPVFSKYTSEKDALEQALKKATSEKQTALQAAGKLRTFAAQQKSLAHGSPVRVSQIQPENQLYYNADKGRFGRNVNSPSSLPVPGYPRIPARYTNNIERVPEGLQGSDEAMAIYAAKKAEQENLEKALADLTEKGPVMSVQDAQRLKQGTYKVLEKKYGQIGAAETEAQKGLARGLKEEIAAAVPAVGPLNQKQSELIKTLKVAGRRALMDENRNPVGIAGLSSSPSQFLMMLADRSALAKSLAARGINAATPEGKNAMIVEALRRGTYSSAPIVGTKIFGTQE